MPIKADKLILIIEDNIDDFEMTERALRKCLILNPVFNLTNGEDATDYLFKRGQFANDAKCQTPSLILLDINMPGMGGIEFLKKIKCDPLLKVIPVIMLTTSKNTNDIKACYDLGANSYIQKPVKFEGLLEAVRAIKNFWFELTIMLDED